MFMIVKLFGSKSVLQFGLKLFLVSMAGWLHNVAEVYVFLYNSHSFVFLALFLLIIWPIWYCYPFCSSFFLQWSVKFFFVTFISEVYFLILFWQLCHDHLRPIWCFFLSLKFIYSEKATKCCEISTFCASH